MRRALKLRQKVSDIFLYDWSGHIRFWIPGPATALRFEFREPGIEGEISLDLDFGRETVDWDEVFDETGARVGEIPLACNRLAILVEGECDDGVTEEQFLRIAQKLTHVYVNRMLSYVRVELSQHWVTPVPVSEWELYWFLYQADAMWVQDGEELEIANVKGFMFARPPDITFDDKDLALDLGRRQTLCDFMEKGVASAVERELLASAKQFSVAFDYRMAAVEAVTALEVSYQRVKRLCQSRKIPAEKLTAVERELGVSAYLKLLVPLELAEEQLGQYWDLVPDCDALRKVRNEIVHGGLSPTEDQIRIVKDGIIAVEGVLDLIGTLHQEYDAQ